MMLLLIFYGIDQFSERFQQNIFKPFELTDFEKRLPIFYSEPDLHSFQNINRGMFLICKLHEKNKGEFINIIKEIDWNNLIADQNARKGFTVFHSTLKSKYNKTFPIVKIKKKYNNRKPWSTDSLKERKKKSNKLYVE